MPPLESYTKEELVQLAKQQWYELEKLKKLIYGAKSERFVPELGSDAQQLRLRFGEEAETEVAPEAVKEQITYERTKPEKKSTPHGRGLLPEHLERKIIIIEPEEETTGMVKIGEDITEVLEIVPPQLYVKRYVRPRYARPQGQGVVQALAPSLPIPRAIAGGTLLAYIIVSKFVDHLPIDRICKMFAREGIKIPTSTVCDWIAAVFTLLKPLYDLHCSLLIHQLYLQIDETRMQVMDSKVKGKTHRGYDWVVYSPVTRALGVWYYPGRKAEYPKELLKGFKGRLQSDGYIVYDHFEKDKDISLFSCWSHGRRKFYEARSNDQKRAEYMIIHIKWLYAIEDFARRMQMTHDERLALRQEHAKPILDHIRSWMEKHRYQVLPKEPIGEAFKYVLERWDKLCRYTDHGDVEIDNNLVENSIRPIALGRKNYLFAGSEEGAKRGAMFYTFFGTCLKNDINPAEWFNDVIARIADHPVNQLAELLPQNWVNNR